MNQIITADPIRVATITHLAKGAHEPNDGELLCAMEAVAFVAGERWSDRPKCASKVIGAFMRSWNDALPDNERTELLLPLIPHLVGTAADKATEDRRAYMATDWLIRIHTPAWLRLAGLTSQADTLTDLPEITGMACIPPIHAPLEAIRKDSYAAGAAAREAARAAAGEAAWASAMEAAGAAARASAMEAARTSARAAAGASAREAAGAAAWAAAGAAAGAAARTAAWAAARAAAWAAARAAAGTAARTAAWAAARAAARAAAWAKLAPTRRELQLSAVALVERMIAAQPVAVAA